MKAGIVAIKDLKASKRLILDANYWLDRTHDVDEEIARAEARLLQTETRLAGLRAKRGAILAEAVPKVRRLT